MSTSSERPVPFPTAPSVRPVPKFDLIGALIRGAMSRGDAALFRTPARVIGGTAPAHVVARRRAANKAARVSRRINRRSAR